MKRIHTVLAAAFSLLCVSCGAGSSVSWELPEKGNTDIALSDLGSYRPYHFEGVELDGQGGFESASDTASLADFLALSHDVDAETASSAEDDLDLYYTVYRVRKGDMIGNLAEAFGVTQDTLISVNNIRSSRLIQIDQCLRIPSMPGILYSVRKDGETAATIAASYKVSEEKITRVNKLASGATLAAGTQLFIPDASLDWVTRQEINGDLFMRPIKNWYYISSRFGWRSSPFTGERSYHGGIDMACPAGTPVYAALLGTVTTAGWSDIYGNYVIITHYSGYKSLYGHMSKINVKKGQFVSTGTKIGEVGSTGLSTGPHLHFTVYKNGTSVNPAALWN